MVRRLLLHSPLTRLVTAMVLVACLVVTAVAVHATRTDPKQAPIVPLAHRGPPLRVLLVGDSLAGTLGVGLAEAAADSGVTLINAAGVGCGVAIAWDGAWASSIWIPIPPVSPCQTARQLSAYWEGLLDRYRPDTVIYANRMDTIDQEVEPGSTARMTSILDPPFQSYLADAMAQAVKVLGSTGAHVILTTSAPTKLGLKGSSYDDPRRWAIYDSILRSIAAHSGGSVSVFDLGRFFGGDGPEPVFSLNSPTGIQWRCRDGLHFTPAAGVLLAPSLFVTARQVSPTPPKAVPAVPASVANRPWPTYEVQKVVMGCVS